jgi:hypothetical protein
LAANGESGSDNLQSYKVQNIGYNLSFKCLILEWCHPQLPTYQTKKFGGFCDCGKALYAPCAETLYAPCGEALYALAVE